MVSDTRVTRPSGRNVLEEMDSRIPTNFYWYLAVLACVGGFLFGYDTANIGSALDFIPYHLSSFWTGYLVARASLGAAQRGSAHRRAADRSLRAQDPADHRRRHLRHRRAPVGVHRECLHAAVVPHAHRARDRGRLRDRHRLHRGVRAPRPARPAVIIQQWMITVGILVSLSWP